MMTWIARIAIEAVVFGALLLGLFHWVYGADLRPPVTLAAIVAIILAVGFDYFCFGRQSLKA